MSNSNKLTLLMKELLISMYILIITCVILYIKYEACVVKQID